MSIESLRAALALPPIAQIGIAVRDVHATTAFYRDTFGIGPFTVYEFHSEKAWYHEQPSVYRTLQGKAMLGNIELEFMQPIEGPSPAREFLEKNGEGLQHLGFLVPDYDDAFGRLVKAGFEPVLRVESFVPTYNGIVKACCFDTCSVGGVMVEIMWKSWLVGA